MNQLPVPRLAELGPQHSKELTSFDRRLFADFHNVDDVFYDRLLDDGARVVGHRDERDDIVSIEALYPQSLSDVTAPKLERQIPEWAAFLDGAAVDPRYRRS